MTKEPGKIPTSCPLTLYMLNFSEGTKTYFYIYVLLPHWHDTGSWNPSSSKTGTYLFYIVMIMGADVLATQGAPTTMILTMLNRINSVPACLGLTCQSLVLYINLLVLDHQQVIAMKCDLSLNQLWLLTHCGLVMPYGNWASEADIQHTSISTSNWHQGAHQIFIFHFPDFSMISPWYYRKFPWCVLYSSLKITLPTIHEPCIRR